MKALLKKYESVNLDEIIIEDGKELKRAMPYLKLSMYIKPEEFPDVAAYRDAYIVLSRPEDVIKEGAYDIPPHLLHKLKSFVAAINDLMKDGEGKHETETENIM